MPAPPDQRIGQTAHLRAGNQKAICREPGTELVQQPVQIVAAHDLTLIVSFYNCKRLNSVLGNLPPTVYERKWQHKNLLLCPKLLDHRKLTPLGLKLFVWI